MNSAYGGEGWLRYLFAPVDKTLSTVMPVVLGALFSLLVVYVFLFSAAGASSPAVFFSLVCALFLNTSLKWLH